MIRCAWLVRSEDRSLLAFQVRNIPSRFFSWNRGTQTLCGRARSVLLPWQIIGRSILLGLEFLIAGDVIRTVIVSHTMTDVAALALMVLVRAFLSFTLTLEIEGKLPWAGRGERDAPEKP